MTEAPYVDVLASGALPEGGRAEVQAHGRTIALVRVDGAVHAVDGLCPHRGGYLAAGSLEGRHLYCPLHAWCFDVKSGEAFFPKGAKVLCFPVREDAGRIWVAPPKPGP